MPHTLYTLNAAWKETISLMMSALAFRGLDLGALRGIAHALRSASAIVAGAGLVVLVLVSLVRAQWYGPGIAMCACALLVTISPFGSDRLVLAVSATLVLVFALLIHAFGPMGFASGYFVAMASLITLYAVSGVSSQLLLPLYLLATVLIATLVHHYPLATALAYSTIFAVMHGWVLVFTYALINALRHGEWIVARSREHLYSQPAPATDVEHQEALRHNTLLQESRQQLQMFGIIAHELRTPAAAANMLAQEPNLEAKRQDLEAVTRQLLDVIDDIRVVTNPDNDFAVTEAPFSAIDLVADIQRNVAPLLSNRAAPLTVHTDFKGHSALLGDAYRLRTIVSNLIRNAYFHSGGDRIVLTVETRDTDASHTAIRICVDDNGNGIAADQLERLFRPFERDSNTVEGAGLGLHIVKTWIERMNGRVHYQHSPEGGARFVVELTLAHFQRPAEVRIDLAPPEPEEEINPFTPGFRVLVVEDDWLNAKLIMSILKRNTDCVVTHASNGQEAVTLIEGKKFDCVLTDFHMPVMDGIELIKTLREREFTQPIIALTAATLGTEVTDLRRAGADDVLAKPLVFEQMAQSLRDIQRHKSTRPIVGAAGLH